MTMLITMLILILSSIFIMMKHPLSMGITLLVQTMLTALISGYLNLNFWYSYILFLIMVGGMLVLFIYMTSVASNEKFKYSNTMMIYMMIMVIMMLIIIMIMDPMLFNNLNYFLENLNMNKKNYLSLSKFINFPFNVILYMMIIYLFITLIAVVKITNINYGPLRQKF